LVKTDGPRHYSANILIEKNNSIATVIGPSLTVKYYCMC